MSLKALVTGATGFVGSNLTEELISLGWEVYALVREESSIGLARIKHISELKFLFHKDILSLKLNKIKDIPQLDVCFHLASYGVDYRQKDINNFIDGNIKFTMQVLEFCKFNGTKKIINTGSCFEYGIGKNEKLCEANNLHPESFYGITKVSAEYMANAYAKENNMKIITVRPFGIFGEYEGLHRVVPQMLKAAIFNEEMKMTGGDQIRDYLYIKDVISAYVMLAELELPQFEAFNICSGNGIKLKEIAAEIAELTYADYEIFRFGSIPYRKEEMMYIVGDNSKIKRYTGWAPKYTIKNGLQQTFEWYRKNINVFTTNN